MLKPHVREDAVYVAGSHHDDGVAFADLAGKRSGDLFERGQIYGFFAYRGGELLGADSERLLFAGGVDVGRIRPVSLTQSRGEVVEETVGTAVCVGLEDAEDGL